MLAKIRTGKCCIATDLYNMVHLIPTRWSSFSIGRKTWPPCRAHKNLQHQSCLEKRRDRKIYFISNLYDFVDAEKFPCISYGDCFDGFNRFLWIRKKCFSVVYQSPDTAEFERFISKKILLRSFTLKYDTLRSEMFLHSWT